MLDDIFSFKVILIAAFSMSFVISFILFRVNSEISWRVVDLLWVLVSVLTITYTGLNFYGNIQKEINNNLEQSKQKVIATIGYNMKNLSCDKNNDFLTAVNELKSINCNYLVDLEKKIIQHIDNREVINKESVRSDIKERTEKYQFKQSNILGFKKPKFSYRDDLIAFNNAVQFIADNANDSIRKINEWDSVIVFRNTSADEFFKFLLTVFIVFLVLRLTKGISDIRDSWNKMALKNSNKHDISPQVDKHVEQDGINKELKEVEKVEKQHD